MLHPLGATGTVLSYNLFAYTENEPVDYVDATGTWAYDVHAGYYAKKDKVPKKVWVEKKYGKYVPYYTKNNKKNGTPIYYGTYYWAIKSGMKAEYAKIIADSCNYVDKKFNPVTEQEWHFNINWGSNKPDSRLLKTLEMSLKAVDCFKKALKYKKGSGEYNKKVKEGLKFLGYALHPLQDMYAHTIDYCYPIYTPAEMYGEHVISHNITWSHIRLFDKTDVVNERKGQAAITGNETKKFIKAVISDFPKIFK